MSIVNDDIRLLLLIVLDKHTSEVRLRVLASLDRYLLRKTHPLDFGPPDWTRGNAVSQHPKPQKRQGDTLREKYAADEGWHVRECITNTSDDKVLERCCLFYERAASLVWKEISFANKLVWDDQNSINCQHQYANDTLHAGSPMNGSAGISHFKTGRRPV